MKLDKIVEKPETIFFLKLLKLDKTRSLKLTIFLLAVSLFSYGCIGDLSIRSWN